jgi:F0F1-type ATP synthase assembly protein I
LFNVSQGPLQRNSKGIALKLLPKPKPVSLDSGVSQGIEMAVGLVVFFLMGWGIDALLGTVPVFMITFTVFAMVGQFVKMYFIYSRDMRHLEEQRAEMLRGGQQ